MSAHQATSWGDWMLGDLSDPVRIAAELLGPSTRVLHLTVTPPEGSRVLPQVDLLVDSAVLLAALRREVVAGEFVSTFEESTESVWTCQVAGLRLHAEVAGGAR